MGTNTVDVHRDDSIILAIYSNTSFTLRCNLNYVPQSGRGARTISTPDTVTGSSRALVATAAVPIPEDGTIDALACVVIAGTGGTVPTQRGQTFVQVFLTRGSASATFSCLAAGYVFLGSTLQLGYVEQPGPGGGQGNMRTIFSNDPAAGVDITVLGVPTGAIWRGHSLGVQLVQGITQTPLPTLRIRDSAGNVLSQTPITTTQISASSTAQLTWARGAVQSSFVAVVGDEFHTAPFPQIDLVAADDIGIITDGIGANTNYGFASLRVEEWVMPN